MGETRKLSDQAIGLASELGTKRKRGSHVDGRNSQAVGSGQRARVSTRHREQESEPSAREKLTRCRIRALGSRQHSAPRASGRAIRTGETHSLSHQAMRLASALSINNQCSQRSVVGQSRLEQSGFSPAQWGAIFDWNRISVTFHQTSSDTLDLSWISTPC